MFLAGDYIGIAIHMVVGMVKKVWSWLKNANLFKIVFGIIKAILGMYKMIYSIPLALGKALLFGAAEIVKFCMGMGSMKKVGNAFMKPFKEWWQGVVNVFNNAVSDIV